MTVFTDASALVAIISGEPDAPHLEAILDADPDRLCSAMSLWETVSAMCRTDRLSTPDARFHVATFSQATQLRLVPIGAREAELALDAYARSGNGRHPAALNMGDCFACARANGASLLFKHNDFRLTDIQPA